MGTHTTHKQHTDEILRGVDHFGYHITSLFTTKTHWFATRAKADGGRRLVCTGTRARSEHSQRDASRRAAARTSPSDIHHCSDERGGAEPSRARDGGGAGGRRAEDEPTATRSAPERAALAAARRRRRRGWGRRGAASQDGGGGSPRRGRPGMATWVRSESEDAWQVNHTHTACSTRCFTCSTTLPRSTRSRRPPGVAGHAPTSSHAPNAFMDIEYASEARDQNHPQVRLHNVPRNC